MGSFREVHRSGLDYLQSVTALLDRIRTTHPTAGLYEAAEVQWWWCQRPKPTDHQDQLFWVDDDGNPEAAFIVTDWGSGVQADPLFLPDVTPDQAARVVERGLAVARDAGFDRVDRVEVDIEDEILRSILTEHGFAVTEKGIVESWMDAEAKPEVTTIADGYRLLSRAEVVGRPHHMKNERRDHVDPEPRMGELSLYRPDLDLVVYHNDNPEDPEVGEVAAYGLCWFSPLTLVGTIEPMRTEDAHQNRGLARHLLTAGIDRLVQAGAERIKICYEPDNPAASHLYVSCGFVPTRQNVVLAGPTGPA